MLKVFITTMIAASIVSCSSNKKSTANGQPNGGLPSTDELFAQMDSE